MPQFLSRKKQNSKTKGANLIAQMRIDKMKEQAEERRNDAVETALSGTAVVLGLVNEAAQFSQVPVLSNAASLALGIVTLIQGVKQNHRLYSLLAKDATDFIATIWRAYHQSKRKADWMSPDMIDVIAELTVTLDDITAYVEEKTKRGMITRVLANGADVGRVQEYRQRIYSAMKKFELASHLKINEAMHQLLQDQLQIALHLRNIGIDKVPPATTYLHSLGNPESCSYIHTSANTSLVTLVSSAVLSQPTHTGTSPPAFIEERPRSPPIDMARPDTLPPSEDSASNIPEPSFPPINNPSPRPTSSLSSMSPFTVVPSPEGGSQRVDTARSGSRRGPQDYDDQWEEEEPRASGKGEGTAAKKNYRTVVHNVSDEEVEDEEVEQEEYNEGGSHDYGNTPLNEYVAGVRRKAAAAVLGRMASAAATGGPASKGSTKNAVGRDEELSIKFSKININSKRKQQQQEFMEEEEEEEEDDDDDEEPIAPPPKKRRPKQPRQQGTYDQYGRHNSYAPDPYYGIYPGPYHGYHTPPPQHYGYYPPPPPPPPRYGPSAMPFMPALGYDMPGNGANLTVTMTNVGNDNRVNIINKKFKTSKRRK